MVDYIDRNPVANMRKPARKVREFFLKPDQWRELLGAISDRQFADVVAFMLFTGARPQEARVVEARHYDKAHGRLVFSRYESKGEKRQRVIYLEDNVREIVERLIKRYPEGTIFRNREGEAWTKNAFNCRFRRLKKKLKMPELCAYTCRHSFAHWKLTSGTDSHIVSKLLGHVDGRMLATRYDHAEQNEAFMLQQAQAALDNGQYPRTAVKISPQKAGCNQWSPLELQSGTWQIRRVCPANRTLMSSEDCPDQGARSRTIEWTLYAIGHCNVHPCARGLQAFRVEIGPIAK